MVVELFVKSLLTNFLVIVAANYSVNDCRLCVVTRIRYAYFLYLAAAEKVWTHNLITLVKSKLLVCINYYLISYKPSKLRYAAISNKVVLLCSLMLIRQ